MLFVIQLKLTQPVKQLSSSKILEKPSKSSPSPSLPSPFPTLALIFSYLSTFISLLGSLPPVSLPSKILSTQPLKARPTNVRSWLLIVQWMNGRMDSWINALLHKVPYVFHSSHPIPICLSSDSESVYSLMPASVYYFQTTLPAQVACPKQARIKFLWLGKSPKLWHMQTSPCYLHECMSRMTCALPSHPSSLNSYNIP